MSDALNIQDVTDPDDPRLDDFRDLNSIDRRPDLPTGKGLVIAEGVLVVQRMLASRFTPHALLGTERRLDELRNDLAGNEVPFYRTSADVMARAVGFHLNRGVLAAARRACQEDQWQAGVLGPQHAVLWGLVTAAGVTSVDQAREVVAASERSVRRWFEDLAAADLVAPAGGRGQWRPGLDPAVAAWLLDSAGSVEGAAARNAASVARERAVFDARVAALSTGDFAAAGLVLGRERLRSAQAAHRPLNPGRRGARLGDTEAVELWEDEDGHRVWVTPRDRRVGIDAVLGELKARWDGGEHAAVVAAVAEWRVQHGLGIPTQRTPSQSLTSVTGAAR